MDYDIFHDESKDTFWHAFLFVPSEYKQILTEHLASEKRLICKQYNRSFGEMSFKNIRKKNRAKARLVRNWNSFAIAALQQCKFTQTPAAYYTASEKGIDRLDSRIGCRFVVLHIPDAHNNMFDHMDALQRIETTMRIGLKGGLHYCFREDDTCNVQSFIPDGEQHYYIEHGRTLDTSRVIQRLQADARLRTYISIPDNLTITPYDKQAEGVETENGYLLQLTDVMLGSVRYLQQNTPADARHARWIASEPLRNLVDRSDGNYFESINSRFHGGFSLSRATLENGGWKFEPIVRKAGEGFQQRTLGFQ